MNSESSEPDEAPHKIAQLIPPPVPLPGNAGPATEGHGAASTGPTSQFPEESFWDGGEGGIRTPGRSFPLRRFSKPLLSTTQPPLREMKYGPKKHPTTSTAEDYQSEPASLLRESSLSPCATPRSSAR